MNKINGKRKKARSLKINLPFIIPEQFLFFDPSFNFLSRNKRPKTGKRQLDESLNFLTITLLLENAPESKHSNIKFTYLNPSPF